MVEPVMYLAIGFLVSMLFGLAILPLVHSRAVRLTTKKLEAATPLSMSEIQADKDQLRAEFAMSARRLEMSVDQLKNKTTNQLAELGKKSDAINRLKRELSEKTAAIFDMEAREKSTREQLQVTESEHTSKLAALRAAEKELGEKQSELAKINSELSERSVTAEARQVELLAVRTQIDALQSRIDIGERDLATTQTQLDEQRNEFKTASHELETERGRGVNLNQRVTELDRQLAVQVKESEQLGSRVRDLESTLATQSNVLRERDEENGKLSEIVRVAEDDARELRERLALLDAGKPALDRLRKENAGLQEQLRASHEERAQIERDLATFHHQAENSWATERMENALLRERINDIAAEVAKLSMALEGPDSPIDEILAAEEAAPPVRGGMVAMPAGGTLADRIRALQSHASRAHRVG